MECLAQQVDCLMQSKRTTRQAGTYPRSGSLVSGPVADKLTALCLVSTPDRDHAAAEVALINFHFSFHTLKFGVSEAAVAHGLSQRLPGPYQDAAQVCQDYPQ